MLKLGLGRAVPGRKGKASASDKAQAAMRKGRASIVRPKPKPAAPTSENSVAGQFANMSVQEGEASGLHVDTHPPLGGKLATGEDDATAAGGTVRLSKFQFTEPPRPSMPFTPVNAPDGRSSPPRRSPGRASSSPKSPGVRLKPASSTDSSKPKQTVKPTLNVGLGTRRRSNITSSMRAASAKAAAKKAGKYAKTLPPPPAGRDLPPGTRAEHLGVPDVATPPMPSLSIPIPTLRKKKQGKGVFIKPRNKPATGRPPAAAAVPPPPAPVENPPPRRTSMSGSKTPSPAAPPSPPPVNPFLRGFATQESKHEAKPEPTPSAYSPSKPKAADPVPSSTSTSPVSGSDDSPPPPRVTNTVSSAPTYSATSPGPQVRRVVRAKRTTGKGTASPAAAAELHENGDEEEGEEKAGDTSSPASAFSAGTEPSQDEQQLFTQGVALRRLGTQLYQEGRYAAALAKYTEALELLPADARLWCNRAAAHVMLDDLEAAIADCAQAAKLDPSLAKAYVRAARSYTGLGLVYRARELLERARSVASGSELDAVLALQSHVEEFESLMMHANVALQSGNASRCLSDVEKALTLFPYDITATLVKVKALVALRRTRFVPDVCVEILPPSLLGRNSRCEFASGPSEEQLQLAVELAMASWTLQDLDKTHAVLDAALRLSPSHPLVTSSRSLVVRAERTKLAGNDAFRSRNYPQAVDLYTAALAGVEQTGNTSFRGVLHSNRAAAYMALFKYREALADCTSALKMDSHHVKARLRRARCFVELEETDAAIRDFQQAVDDMKEAGAAASELGSVMVELERARLARDSSRRKEEWRSSGRPQRRSSHRSTSSNSSWSSAGTRSSRDSGYRAPPPPPPPPEVPATANHYEVLGVEVFTATTAQIRKAYHKMALKYHPDKARKSGQSSPADLKAAEEKFKQVAEAYRVLSDSVERPAFDRALREEAAQLKSRRKWWGFRRR